MTQHQINPCLKRVFTAFNVFFAIVGGLILALAVLSHAVTRSAGGGIEYNYGGLIVLYVLGSFTMLISILGAYGAHRENRVSLILFLVCMVIGSLVMLRAGVPAAFLRSELDEVMEDKLKDMVPLDQTTQMNKNAANEVQEWLQCCGLFSYKDWEGQIPDSCLCDDLEVAEGQCMSINYDVRAFQMFGLAQPKSIHKEPCYPLIKYYVNLMADVVLGVIFTLAVLALLGMVLSSVMIHQLRAATRTTMIFTMPPVFNPQPPKYQELYNTA